MTFEHFFTDFELNLLKELVQNNISVIENKRADVKSIKEKKTAWCEIADGFNSYYNVNKRDDKQLRKCWDNLKARAKKKDVEERRERLRNGGGKVSVSDVDSLQVGAMVATQIKPMQNQYDGDFGPDDECKDQLQCAQEEHSMKMEILRLKKIKLEPQLQTRNTTSTPNSRSRTTNFNKSFCHEHRVSAPTVMANFFSLA